MYLDVKGLLKNCSLAAFTYNDLLQLIIYFQHGSERSPECFWLIPILQDFLRHIYQRFILETDSDVIEMAYKVKYMCY